MEVKGKFQGDDFEVLYAKVEKTSPILFITVSLGGYTLEFDLSIHASVYEDTADQTNLILDYHKNIIIFKVSNNTHIIIITAIIIAFLIMIIIIVIMIMITAIIIMTVIITIIIIITVIMIIAFIFDMTNLNISIQSSSSIYSSILSTHLSFSSIYKPIFLSTHLFIHSSFYPLIYLSPHPSYPLTYLSPHLSLPSSISPSIDFYLLLGSSTPLTSC